MSSLRIFHCIPSMMGGGAERQLCYLSDGLVRLGHTVEVATMVDGVNGPRLRATGATVHLLSARASRDPRLVRDLFRVIRARRPDVVETWLTRMDIAGGSAALAANVPWVYSERSVWPPPAAPLLNALHWSVVQTANAIIANSEHGARSWRKRTRALVEVIPNALPLSELKATIPAHRGELGLADDAQVILVAGRFSPEKNHGLLARALADVLRVRPRAVAYCCGVGEELAPFRRVVDAAGVGARCITPGYRDDLWRVMSTSDVMISASLREGNPNVVLEAMALGCPLVLSDIAEHRECADERGAVFFAATAESDAVTGLLRVLDDPIAAGERARASQARVQSRSVVEMAERYLRVYREVVGAKTGALRVR